MYKGLLGVLHFLLYPCIVHCVFEKCVSCFQTISPFKRFFRGGRRKFLYQNNEVTNFLTYDCHMIFCSLFFSIFFTLVSSFLCGRRRDVLLLSLMCRFSTKDRHNYGELHCMFFRPPGPCCGQAPTRAADARIRLLIRGKSETYGMISVSQIICLL